MREGVCTHLSVLPSACFSQSVPAVRASESRMFSRYLQYLLIDFRQTFAIGVSWDKDEVIKFWGQRSKVKVTLLLL